MAKDNLVSNNALFLSADEISNNTVPGFVILKHTDPTVREEFSRLYKLVTDLTTRLNIVEVKLQKITQDPGTGALSYPLP